MAMEPNLAFGLPILVVMMVLMIPRLQKDIILQDVLPVHYMIPHVQKDIVKYM